MKEIWKQFRNTNYSVSNFGRVKNNLRDNILKHGFKGKRNERPFVNLGKGNSFYIHRMVAESFINNPEKKPQVNHKDGNTLNNHVNNLEWCTQQENMVHALENKLYSNKLIENDIRLIRMMCEYGLSTKTIAQLFSVSSRTICDVRSRRSWKHV